MLKVNNLIRIGKKEEERLIKLCQENRVSSLAVFGSLAQGAPRKTSDIDLLIEFEKGQEKSLLDLVRIQFKLQRVFRRKVDLVTKRGLSPYLKDYVLKDIRVFYEK